MFGKKHSKPQSRIDSLIGAGTTIEGDLNFSGGMRIDGQVNGNVVATPGKPSTLVLSEHARGTGEINVTHLVINGDVHYKTLEIQLGAIVEGRLIHSNATAQDKVVAFKLNSGE